MENDSGSTVDLVCPVTDENNSSTDGSFNAESIGTLTPNGDDNSSTDSVTFAACVTYKAGGSPGGACDTTYSTGAAAVFRYHSTALSTTVWAHDYDFAYIWATLPPTDVTNGDSTIKGFYYLST